MLGSVLIGLPAGARALTPLAAVSDAARRGVLPKDNGAPAWLGSPFVELGLVTLAAGELWGDKLRSAPDRIVPAGVAARVVSAGPASGPCSAPRRRSPRRTSPSPCGDEPSAGSVRPAPALSKTAWRSRCPSSPCARR